jgi:hypothetical protein
MGFLQERILGLHGFALLQVIVNGSASNCRNGETVMSNFRTAGANREIQAMYVECVGTPALEYMLCVNGLKLAESKGLHRKPARDWNLEPSEVCTRAHLWWTLYILERHFAFRAGRPVVSSENDQKDYEQRLIATSLSTTMTLPASYRRMRAPSRYRLSLLPPRMHEYLAESSKQ